MASALWSCFLPKVSEKPARRQKGAATANDEAKHSPVSQPVLELPNSPKTAALQDGREPDAPHADCELDQLTLLVKQLSCVQGSWLEQLQHNTALLQELLQASLVSVSAISMDGNSYVVLTADGVGAELLDVGLPQLVQPAATATGAADPGDDQHHRLQHSSSTVKKVCNTPAQPLTSLQLLYQTQKTVTASAASAHQLPSDWQKLHQSHGLTEFTAIPIWCSSAIGGALAVATGSGASPAAVASAKRGWPQLSVVAAFLSHLLQDEGVRLACDLLEHLQPLRDIDGLVRILSRGVIAYCKMKVHLVPQCRIALIRSDATAAAIFEEPVKRTSLTAASSRQASYASYAASMCSDDFSPFKRTTTDDIVGELSLRRRHSCAAPTASTGLLHSIPARRSSMPDFVSLARLPAVVERSAHSVEAPKLKDLSGPHLKSLNSTSRLSPATEGWPAGITPRVSMSGHSLLLSQTILGRAIQRQAGLWVTDCTLYLQDDRNACCKDIFVGRITKNVLSLAVTAAFTSSGQPLLGIYVVFSTPLPAPLLKAIVSQVDALLQVLTPMVAAKLKGDVQEEWKLLHDSVLDPDVIRNPDMMASVGAAGQLGSTQVSVQGAPHRESSDPSDPSASPGEVAGRYSNSGATTGLRPSFIIESAANTSGGKIAPMLAAVHDKLRSMQARLLHGETYDRSEDLGSVELLERLGQGGFGTVFRAIFNGIEVAVKVTQPGDMDSERQGVRDAFELAVMSSVSHPNIVQVLTFFTDVSLLEASAALQVGSPGAHNDGGTNPAAANQEPQLPDNLQGHASHLVASTPDVCPRASLNHAMAIVMELCDGGSLADAIGRGLLKEYIKGGFGAFVPRYAAVYSCLLEIAMALRHLHSLNLVHCDLKPSNVLLRTSMHDQRGFTCKLGDFGLVKLMMEDASGQPLISRDQEDFGTITHMSPEALYEGSDPGVDPRARDIYAFGILMYELVTGAAVYVGMKPSDIRKGVVQGTLRPEFPAYINREYRTLAEACWSHDITSRPTAVELVSIIRRLSSSSGSLTYAKLRRHSSVISIPRPPSRSRSKSYDEFSFPLHIL